jgi:Immunity protein 35
MITFAEARDLVAKTVGQHPDWLAPEDEVVIVDEMTIERPWGWVFFYTSRLWLDTEDIKYAIAGNSPLFVERASGKVLETGTSMPVAEYIANYERTGRTLG